MANQSRKVAKKAIESRKEVGRTSSQMQSNQTCDRMVEVMSIAEDGFWLRVYEKEYFTRKRMGCEPREYFVSFERFPWFLGATDDEIRQVTVSAWFCGLHWRVLDVDFELSHLEKQSRNWFRYMCFTYAQLDRLKKYNDEQKAKGGKQWLNERLCDFEYWRQIND